MMTRTQIARLLPHGADMVLLDAVSTWDGRTIECAIRSHRDPHNPLRRDDLLPAMAVLEYAAQAMAVHAALSRGGRPMTSGFLTSIRDLRLGTDRLDDAPAPLRLSAEQRYAADTGFVYGFELRSADALLASGQLSVMGEHAT